METLHHSKTSIIESSQQQMRSKLPKLDWTLRQKLAATCRILFLHGHDSGLAGQITARTGEENTFYTQQLGYGFDEITASSLLKVNEDLQVLQGEGMANPANRFHSWIYRARPDVSCIIHTHPLHVSALSLLERPLKVAHMDSCMLYEDVGFLAKWPGVPVGNEEGRLISEVLGDKRAAILAHHGLVVAASSVEEACVLAIQIERSAKLQLLAEASGQIQEIPPQLAREAHDWILQSARSQASFAYFARQLLRTLDASEQGVLLS